jgi:hypothetical protein
MHFIHGTTSPFSLSFFPKMSFCKKGPNPLKNISVGYQQANINLPKVGQIRKGKFQDSAAREKCPIFAPQ